MYDLVSFVSRGKIRKEVLRILNKPMTPTQLSMKIKTHRPTISRALIDLKNKKLVKCVTPGEKMGRYYEITAKGNQVIKIVMDK
jgi:DNA-binding transcriptional ArsR family regulator